MTLTQLAKLAHVSVSTASKAFSMSPEVNEQTRDMIFALAKEHGCFRRYYNAAYPKLVVAVIVPNFSSNTLLLSSCQERLAEHNCEICVACSNYSAERELELIKYYDTYVKVDGIILASPNAILPESIETPIAAIDPYNDTPDSIIFANRSVDEAYREAIGHFLAHGVRDIGFIGDRLSRSKIELYRRFMKELVGEVREELISVTDSDNTGREAMEALFARGITPRGLISSHNSMTFGAIKAIRARGLSVPEDVAIITFGGGAPSFFGELSLTGVNIFERECAIRTADALISRINDQPYEKRIILDSKIIYRRSSEI